METHWQLVELGLRVHKGQLEIILVVHVLKTHRFSSTQRITLLEEKQGKKKVYHFCEQFGFNVSHPATEEEVEDEDAPPDHHPVVDQRHGVLLVLDVLVLCAHTHNNRPTTK